jgi:hypothetical protein
VWGIAGIAEIARNRRNLKGKTLPLINADDADQNGNREALPRDQEIARSAKIVKIAEIGKPSSSADSREWARIKDICQESALR